MIRLNSLRKHETREKSSDNPFYNQDEPLALPAPYQPLQIGFTRESPPYKKRIELKKQKLNEYAQDWNSIPRAYEFLIDNHDLLQSLSKEEVIDFYARAEFYAKTTGARSRLSYGHCEELLKKITTKHPGFNRDPKKSKLFLKNQVNYVIPALFKPGEYFEKNKTLGARLKGSGLETKADLFRRQYLRVNGIEKITQNWELQ